MPWPFDDEDDRGLGERAAAVVREYDPGILDRVTELFSGLGSSEVEDERAVSMDEPVFRTRREAAAALRSAGSDPSQQIVGTLPEPEVSSEDLMPVGESAFQQIADEQGRPVRDPLGRPVGAPTGDIAEGAARGMRRYTASGQPSASGGYVRRDIAPADIARGEESERYTGAAAPETRERLADLLSQVESGIRGARGARRSLPWPLELATRGAEPWLDLFEDEASGLRRANPLSGVSPTAAASTYLEPFVEGYRMLGGDAGHLGDVVDAHTRDARMFGDTGSQALGALARDVPLAIAGGVAAGAAEGLPLIGGMVARNPQKIGLAGDALLGYMEGRSQADPLLGEDPHQQGLVSGGLTAALTGPFRYLAARGPNAPGAHAAGEQLGLFDDAAPDPSRGFSEGAPRPRGMPPMPGRGSSAQQAVASPARDTVFDPPEDMTDFADFYPPAIPGSHPGWSRPAWPGIDQLRIMAGAGENQGVGPGILDRLSDDQIRGWLDEGTVGYHDLEGVRRQASRTGFVEASPQMYREARDMDAGLEALQMGGADVPDDPAAYLRFRYAPTGPVRPQAAREGVGGIAGQMVDAGVLPPDFELGRYTPDEIMAWMRDNADVVASAPIDAVGREPMGLRHLGPGQYRHEPRPYASALERQMYEAVGERRPTIVDFGDVDVSRAPSSPAVRTGAARPVALRAQATDVDPIEALLDTESVMDTVPESGVRTRAELEPAMRTAPMTEARPAPDATQARIDALELATEPGVPEVAQNVEANQARLAEARSPELPRGDRVRGLRVWAGDEEPGAEAMRQDIVAARREEGPMGWDTAAFPEGTERPAFAVPSGEQLRDLDGQLQAASQGLSRGQQNTARRRVMDQWFADHPEFREWFDARGRGALKGLKGVRDRNPPTRAERGLPPGGWTPPPEEHGMGLPPGALQAAGRGAGRLGGQALEGLLAQLRGADGRGIGGSVGLASVRRPETAFGRLANTGVAKAAQGTGRYVAAGGIFSGSPHAAATGGSMMAAPQILRGLDWMVAQGRYANIPALNALRALFQGGGQYPIRGIIAFHTAMQEDPEFRQAFRAAEESLPGAGPSGDTLMSQEEFDALGESSGDLEMDAQEFDALGR